MNYKKIIFRTNMTVADRNEFSDDTLYGTLKKTKHVQAISKQAFEFCCYKILTFVKISILKAVGCSDCPMQFGLKTFLFFFFFIGV